MLKINRIVVLGIFILSQLTMVAQNNTNSPYTRFGYGELAGNSFGAGRAMGGIGYGLRSSKQINPLNPASYNSMDSMTFLLDFGASAQLSWFDDGLNKQTNVNGNLEYIAMQFPLHRRVAMSVGLLPYSYVGYDFGSINTIPGSTTQYQEQFIGTGGLNQLYGGLSVDIWKKRLSVGANVGYLFGNITHERNIQVYQSNADMVNKWQKIRVSDIKLDFGLQYTQPISKKEHVTIGAVYSPKNMLSNKVFEVQTQGTAATTISDTIKNVPMGLPNSYGLGFTYVKDNKLTVGADVLYEEWKKVSFPFTKSSVPGVNDDTRFENRFRIGVGAEYIPDYLGKNFFNRIKYRAGAHFSNSYLQIRNSGYDEYGASVGFGLPMVDNRSVLNFSFEYVKVAPRTSTLINEQYFRFTVNYTFNERWFLKWKLD